MKVTIERETRKALLVAANGRKGWIQRRWYKDGHVSDKTFERAATEYEEREAQKAAHAAWRNEYHEIVVYEMTDRAISTRVRFCSGDCEQEVTRLLWFPRSMVRGSNHVPGWMIEQRVDDALKSFPSNACAFLHPEDAERLFG